MNILCYGDSNTWGAIPHAGGGGGRWPRGVRWPGALQALLPKDYVMEDGVCGRTTVFADPFSPGRNGLASLPESLERCHPLDVVVLALGINDCQVTRSANVRCIAKGLEKLILTVRQAQCGPGGGAPRILVVCPAPTGPLVEQSPYPGFEHSSYEKSLQLPAAFSAVAAANGCLFLDAGRVAHASAVDQLHFDAPSHGALARAVADCLNAARAEIEGSEKPKKVF